MRTPMPEQMLLANTQHDEPEFRPRGSNLSFETTHERAYGERRDLRSCSNPQLNYWRQVRQGNSLSRTSNYSNNSGKGLKP